MDSSKHLIEAMKLKVDLTGVAIPSPFIESIENEKHPSILIRSVARTSPKFEVSGFQIVEMHSAIDEAILQLEEFRQTLMAKFDSRINSENHLEAAKNL
ncbi:hypothetical protein ABXV18_24500 [Vibrio owensii]|uniref:hypothetical protein n=1 Tax=Vibrio owensii TaxID=696485 RepID=UPI00339B8489